MPDLSRRPETIWEERVDFDRISRAQEARQRATLRVLRKVIFDQQRQTLRWVRVELGQKKLKTAVARFSLPLKPRYRRALRTKLIAAARRGVADVAEELSEATPKMSIAEMSRVRARADALFEDHMNRLEGDLKREWSKAMFGVIDKRQLDYATRLVFAKFAGWEAPSEP